MVETGEISVFVGRDFVITVRRGEPRGLQGLRRSLERDPERLALGPSAVLHAIMDRIVDDYTPAMDGLNIDVEQVEEEVFSGSRTNPAQRIYYLKREVLQFIRATAPLIDPLDHLAAGHYAQVHPEVTPYFRDVNDHLTRTVEQVMYFDDLLNSVLSARLAQVSVDQNNDMRKIAAWAGIAAVWTAIAGIYGMNFEFMPEIHWTYGYPGVLAVMVTVSLLLYLAAIVAIIRMFRPAGTDLLGHLPDPGDRRVRCQQSGNAASPMLSTTSSQIGSALTTPRARRDDGGHVPRRRARPR